MVREAEQFKEQDDRVREGQKARNELEGLVFGAQSQLEAGEGKLPLSEDEKAQVRAKLAEIQQWMEGNRYASREEYDAKKRELEALIQPIFAKYGGQGAPGMGGMGGFPGGFPGAGAPPAAGGAPAAGPAVDDLD